MAATETVSKNTLIKATRLSAPAYVQLELTTMCNNRCFFCYNHLTHGHTADLDTQQFKKIIDELADAGVVLCNFNGGEPLLRPDLFELVDYALELGLETHLNTNGTLITDELASKIKARFNGVCLSLLSANPELHEQMVGRAGAWQEAINGMDALHRANKEFSVNICATKINYQEIYSIARLVAAHGGTGLCVTRYVLNDPLRKDLILGSPELEIVLHQIKKIRKEIEQIQSIRLPCPVPFCEVGQELLGIVKDCNVPCKIGLDLARITADGKVTPCTLSSTIMGDLRKNSFQEIWQDANWDRYARFEHLTDRCLSCDLMTDCRGGCDVCDQTMIAAGIVPRITKWEQQRET